jgi:hypothetical protein
VFNFGKRGFGEVEEVKMFVERHYRDLCIYVEIDLGNAFLSSRFMKIVSTMSRFQ